VGQRREVSELLGESSFNKGQNAVQVQRGLRGVGAIEVIADGSTLSGNGKPEQKQHTQSSANGKRCCLVVCCRHQGFEHFCSSWHGPDGNTDIGNSDIALRSVLGSQRQRTRRRRKHPSEQATKSGHRRVQQQTLRRHQSCSTSLEAAFSAELPRR